MSPMNISELSPAQLRKAAKMKERIVRLQSELDRLFGSKAGPEAAPKKRTRRMSAAGRARIVAAQKARWAKIKAGKK